MNKVIVLFLITVFLCANTSIGQLFKVPNLLEHYKEFKKEVNKNSNSFTQFIKDHYAINAEDNQKEHQNLPFKTFDNTINVLFAFPIFAFQLELLRPLISVEKKFFYKNLFKSNLFTSIWLPPKIH